MEVAFTVHGPHPDVHTHGLADGCGACEEAALNPFAFLDDALLRDLVRRVVGDLEHARTQAEAVAMQQIREALNRFGRLAKLEPRTTDWLARWDVHVTFGAACTAPPAQAPETPPDAVGTA